MDNLSPLRTGTVSPYMSLTTSGATDDLHTSYHQPNKKSFMFATEEEEMIKHN